MASTLGTITTAAYVAGDPWSKINEAEPRKSVARFRVLHNPFGKDQEGKDLPPIAINYVAFGGQAKVVADFLKKGSCPTVIANIKTLSLATKDGEYVKDKNGNFIINLDAEIVQLHLGARTGESTKASAAAESSTAETSGELAGAPF